MHEGRPRLLLVSPRPPRRDGQGDQRRAQVALAALSQDWAVEVISWLPDANQSLGRRQLARPVCLLRAVLLSAVRPVHVALVQSLAPRSLARQLRHGDPIVFMTDRSVPVTRVGPYVIDFIDDLGGAALRRAASLRGPRSWFWRWEGGRLRRLDARLAARAARAVAISEQDAAAIGPSVGSVPAAIGTRPMAGAGTKVVFTGNLFYPPNRDAATWICTELAPGLARRGVDPSIIVIAGRRPPPSLCQLAAAAGVNLKADVADLDEVLREAAVVLSPVVFGSGVQNKLLDAVGAGRACILTPFANQPLGLVDRESALIRERTPSFAEAVVELLADSRGRQRLAERAREQLAGHAPEAVDQAWRDCVQQVSWDQGRR